MHNMDVMIQRAGGSIVSSEWVGTSVSGSSPSHVILAEPQKVSRAGFLSGHDSHGGLVPEPHGRRQREEP